MILLNDTTPDEPKSLVEAKIKKVVTQPAPSGPTVGGGGGAGVPQTPVRGADATAAGSLAAMLTLAAVDEDEEGGEEAEVPSGFDYETEGEEDDDE